MTRDEFLAATKSADGRPRDPETKERAVDYGPGGRLPAVPV